METPKRLVDAVRSFLKHQVAKMIGVSRGATEDATDVVQVALLQAIERIDTFQGDTLAKWRSWLITIARNKVSLTIWFGAQTDRGGNVREIVWWLSWLATKLAVLPVNWQGRQSEIEIIWWWCVLAAKLAVLPVNWQGRQSVIEIIWWWCVLAAKLAVLPVNWQGRQGDCEPIPRNLDAQAPQSLVLIP